MPGEPTLRQAPYRWHAFTHWLNLAFLAGAAFGGAVIDPIIWMLAAPLEIGAMWVLPDLPLFRTGVDRWQKSKDFAREKAYYMKQLWGLGPKRNSLAEEFIGWFVDTDNDDLDARVLRRDDTFQQYSEMKQIIARLVELEKVRGVSIVSHEISRFEQVILGYLRYLIACRFLSEALKGIEADQLKQEIGEIDKQIKEAAADLRPVLLERRRLRDAQLERLPKLRATLELFRTRADTIVYQMRNIHSQVLADPGVDVNNFLEDMMEKNELLADPLGELEADQAVRELLHAPASSDDVRRRALIAQEGAKKLRQS
jgi:hypothetical protein